MSTMTADKNTAWTERRDALAAAALAPYTALDGTLDTRGLVSAALFARRKVEELEEQVNRGHVTQRDRDRLADLQHRDIILRRALDQHVPGWREAVRRAAPRRSKLMEKAARAMGLS